MIYRSSSWKHFGCLQPVRQLQSTISSPESMVTRKDCPVRLVAKDDSRATATSHPVQVATSGYPPMRFDCSSRSRCSVASGICSILNLNTGSNLFMRESQPQIALLAGKRGRSTRVLAR